MKTLFLIISLFISGLVYSQDDVYYTPTQNEQEHLVVPTWEGHLNPHNPCSHSYDNFDYSNRINRFYGYSSGPHWGYPSFGYFYGFGYGTPTGGYYNGYSGPYMYSNYNYRGDSDRRRYGKHAYVVSYHHR